MTAFSEERIDVNGVDTAVFTAGEGAPIVVLHGGGTAPGFDELLPLAEHARLILPIHPGFGASGDAPASNACRTTFATTWICSIGWALTTCRLSAPPWAGTWPASSRFCSRAAYGASC